MRYDGGYDSMEKTFQLCKLKNMNKQKIEQLEEEIRGMHYLNC